MKTSWVLTDEERKQRLIQRNRRRQTVASPTVGTVATTRFTAEEHQLTNSLAKVFEDTLYSKYLAFFSDDVDSFVTFIRNCCEGRIFSFELVKKLETIDNRIINENGFRSGFRLGGKSSLHPSLSLCLSHSLSLCLS